MADLELGAHLLSGRVLVADGGIGTGFLASGVAVRDLPLLPIEAPDAVFQLHLAYLAAGAQLIETHTFQANSSKLSNLGLSADVFHLNRRAAQIARHARDTHGEPAYIVGSLGPLASVVKTPWGAGMPYDAAVASYQEAVQGLVAGGVDGFIVETMSDVLTVQAALEAIRAESSLPVIVTFAFSPMGTTLYGLSPEEAINTVISLPGGPPLLVGANCGSGPAPLLDAILRMAPIARQHGIGLAAYPNAGEPSRRGEHIHYPASAQYVGTIAPALKAAGCLVVGGCCGTTPDHVRAISQALSTPSSMTIESWAPLANESITGVEPRDFMGADHALSSIWPNRFVISVELDPPRGITLTRIMDAARRVQESGADVVNIGDSPMARVRLSALATARLMQEQVGVQTIMHFTTRDRNLMGLQSDLLGAHALGIRNVLCLTGDPPGLGDYAHATAVYDLDSIGLVRVLKGFNEGHDAVGQPIGAPTHFNIGVGMNPNGDNITTELERLKDKIEAGAQFIMSQPIYDPVVLYRFMDQAPYAATVPLLLGVMPLISYRQALYLHNEVPGITIPTPILEKLSQVTDAAALGMDLALTLLDQLGSLAAGVYLVPSYNRVDNLLPLIGHIRRQYGAKNVSQPPSNG